MTVVESTRRRTRRADAIRTVLAFTFRHWRRQPLLVGWVAFAMVAATMADVFMPFFAGRLVDALTLVSADRDAAEYAALTAFGAMVALGAGMVVLRHLAFIAIIQLTLKMMADIAPTPSTACSASRPTGTPTASPARPCARSRAACGRSTCSTTRS